MKFAEQELGGRNSVAANIMLHAFSEKGEFKCSLQPFLPLFLPGRSRTGLQREVLLKSFFFCQSKSSSERNFLITSLEKGFKVTAVLDFQLK
jgi:hypothetical protein